MNITEAKASNYYRDVISHHEAWLRLLLTIATAGIGGTIALISKLVDNVLSVCSLSIAMIFWIILFYIIIRSHTNLKKIYEHSNTMDLNEFLLNETAKKVKSYIEADLKEMIEKYEKKFTNSKEGIIDLLNAGSTLIDSIYKSHGYIKYLLLLPLIFMFLSLIIPVLQKL